MPSAPQQPQLDAEPGPLGLDAYERAHLRRIARHKVLRGKAWRWCMTVIPIHEPLLPALQGLVDKGLVEASDRIVCGPLRTPEGVWGVAVTDKGEIAARLLGLVEGVTKQD